MECETTHGWRPIHYICRFLTDDIIKYVVIKNVKLTCLTSNGNNIMFMANQNPKLSPEFKKSLNGLYSIAAEQLESVYNNITDPIKNNNFCELLKYKKFDLHRMLEDNSFVNLLINCVDDDIAKHVIDHSDITCQSSRHVQPIHVICQHGSIDLIEYIISKNVNIECKTDDDWKPIHFVCRYRSENIIRLVILKCKDIKCWTKIGENIIDLIRLNTQIYPTSQIKLVFELSEQIKSI